MDKPDLNKAGGRLKYSIECLTDKSFNEFANTVKSVTKRTLYNWIEKKELTSEKLNHLSEELPGLNHEYIIHNDRSKEPNSEIANYLQIKELIERIEKLEQTVKRMVNLPDREKLNRSG